MGRIISVVVGVAIGAALAGLGLWLGEGVDTDEQTAAINSTTTTVAGVEPVALEPAWTDEAGVRFESTVIVVDDFYVEDDSAVLDYRLIALGGGNGFFFGGAQLPVVLPEDWELVTQSGGIVTAVSDPPRNTEFVEGATVTGLADSIRFEAGDGTELGEVAAVRVTGWRVAVPVETVAEMAGVSGASARLFDGTVMSIQTILEQRTGALIDFDLERPSDPWRVGIDQGFGVSTEFVGAGSGWKRASSTIGGLGLSGGITGFQLVWNDPTPPDVVRVRASLVSWEPLGGDVTIWSAT